MEFDWLTIFVALGLAFAAWKIIKGLVKFAVIAGILGGGAYIYSQGYLA